jgi:hypothetical protein
VLGEVDLGCGAVFHANPRAAVLCEAGPLGCRSLTGVMFHVKHRAQVPV